MKAEHWAAIAAMISAISSIVMPIVIVWMTWKLSQRKDNIIGADPKVKKRSLGKIFRSWGFGITSMTNLGVLIWSLWAGGPINKPFVFVISACIAGLCFNALFYMITSLSDMLSETFETQMLMMQHINKIMKITDSMDTLANMSEEMPIHLKNVTWSLEDMEKRVQQMQRVVQDGQNFQARASE